MKEKKYIGIDPDTGLYEFIGYFKSTKEAQKSCSWYFNHPWLIGKEANRALKTMDDTSTKKQKKLRVSLKDAILKAKLAKAVEKMVKITSLSKKMKK